MDINTSINCTVSECKYNAQDQQYCTLNTIMIGTHEKNPKVPECTDCKSFEKK